MTALRTLRRRQLLSQRDLARKAGVTASTIYLIETGRTEPRLKIMRLICDALNVSPMEIDEFRDSLERQPDVTPVSARRAA
jgi:DNA-binding XRE family transcriptional regulator